MSRDWKPTQTAAVIQPLCNLCGRRHAQTSSATCPPALTVQDLVCPKREAEAHARGYREGVEAERERCARICEGAKLANPFSGEDFLHNSELDTLARVIRAEAATPSPKGG